MNQSQAFENASQNKRESDDKNSGMPYQPMAIVQKSNPKQPTSVINMSMPERWLSLFGGIALVVYSLANRKWYNVATGGLGAEFIRRAVSGHCYVYRALGVSTAVKTNPQAVSVPHNQGIHVSEVIVVNQPVNALYRYWRDFSHLPVFMDHLESIDVKDDNHSTWIVKAPLGTRVAWDAEIVNDVPNEVIAWRSLPGSQIANAGSVRFAPRDEGSTEVRVELEYVPPAGQVGAALAAALGSEPRVQVQDALRRFKQIMEAGETTYNDNKTWWQSGTSSSGNTGGGSFGE